MTAEIRTPTGATATPIDAAHAALYAALPAIPCQLRCAPACGPLVAAEVEWQRMEAVTGGASWSEDTVCPHLDDAAGLCRAHELRPLICRLWGVVETMPCPYGCQPERWLTAEEADTLIAAVLALSGGRVTSGWHGWRQLIAHAPDAPETVA